MKGLMFLVAMISTLSTVFAGELVLINRGASLRSSGIVAAEKVSILGTDSVYRELSHPSRLGGITVDGQGNPALGLIKASSSNIVRSTSAGLLDKNGNDVNAGDIVLARYQVGRRSHLSNVTVIANFNDGTMLITTKPEFAVEIEKHGISSAIESMGYFSLSLVQATSTVRVN